MPTVLLTAPYMIPLASRIKSILAGYGIDLIEAEVSERMGEADLLRYAGQFDGTLCGDDHYTARVLQACSPRLKVISKWGTGIDSIDQQAAARLGIKVCRTLNAFTLPVADSIMGYILTFARRLPWMDRQVKSGKWKKMQGVALHECTLGVIGVGNIGKALLGRARSFGMQLLGNDIIEIDRVFLAELGVEMTALDDLLHRADFVSLNCDLNPTSIHLMNARTFNLMKPTGILINTARGQVVEETALVEALRSGRIAGAALDVFEVEPLPRESPLRKMDNVLLAPHNANSSPAAWERVHLNTVCNLLDGLGIVHGDVHL